MYFQRGGEEERKRGREMLMHKRNISPLPLACPHPGAWLTMRSRILPSSNGTSDTSVCRMMPSPRSYTGQDSKQAFRDLDWYAPESDSTLQSKLVVQIYTYIDIDLYVYKSIYIFILKQNILIFLI